MIRMYPIPSFLVIVLQRLFVSGRIIANLLHCLHHIVVQDVPRRFMKSVGITTPWWKTRVMRLPVVHGSTNLDESLEKIGLAGTAGKGKVTGIEENSR
jgi:hypothetical protein